MIRIFFFDLDGTLVEDESSWRIIHRFLGTDHLAARALEKFSKGEINYEEFVKHDVGLWPRRLHRKIFEHVFSKVKIRPEAERIFKKLEAKHVLRAIVTSGLDILAKRVCNELDADECVSNELVFDSEGFFTGIVKINVDPSRKAEALISISRRYSIALSEAAAVGDTIYDKSMFRVVNNSIIYVKPGTPLPRDHGATYAVNSLEDIMQFIE